MEGDSVGRSYHQRSGWQSVQGAKLLEMARPAPGERVLDVGCGTGRLTELLAQAVGPSGHVTGIDVDADRLRIASQRPPGNVTYRQENGQGACERTPNAWNLVFANYVIHWMPDRPRFFLGVYRALRPGGRCALSTIESLPGLFQTLCELAGPAGEGLLKRLHFPALEHVTRDLTKVGFKIQWAVKSLETKQFASVDEALEFWEATTAGAVRKDAIPPAAIARLRQDPAGSRSTIAEQVIRVVAVKPA